MNYFTYAAIVFRVRRDDARVRCFTRNGHDWFDRFPAIVEAANRIKASSFLIDGEAVIARDDGTPDFHALSAGDCKVGLTAYITIAEPQPSARFDHPRHQVDKPNPRVCRRLSRLCRAAQRRLAGRRMSRPRAVDSPAPSGVGRDY